MNGRGFFYIVFSVSALTSTTGSRASATMFFSQLPVNKRKSKPKN